jgi:hypothetical protein
MFFLRLQTREKFLSLGKGTKTDVATALEEVGFCISHLLSQLKFVIPFFKLACFGHDLGAS